MAYGVPAMTALDAANSIEQELDVEVWDARFAKPIDVELVESALKRGIPILTIEEQGLIGGFGAALVEEAASRGLDASLIERAGLPDRWIHQGSRDEQLAEAGLDVPGIVRSIRAAAARRADPHEVPVAELPRRQPQPTT